MCMQDQKKLVRFDPQVPIVSDPMRRQSQIPVGADGGIQADPHCAPR